MPIYEYECKKCGHLTEVWQNFSDPPITKCEMCKGKMKKLISQNTFRLKGTGWYVTDYASKRDGYQGKSEKSDRGTSPKKAKSTTDTSKKEGSSSSDKNSKD